MVFVVAWRTELARTIESAVYRGLRAGITPLISAINDLKGKVMASVEELNTAIDGVYESLLPSINEIHGELASLRELVQGDGVSPEDLSQAISRLSGVTNRVRDSLADLVDNDATPEPTESLPDLPEPLPEEPPVVPANGLNQDVPVTESTVVDNLDNQ